MDTVAISAQLLIGIRNYLSQRPYAEVGAVMPTLDAILARRVEPPVATEPEGDPTILGDRQRVRAMARHAAEAREQTDVGDKNA